MKKLNYLAVLMLLFFTVFSCSDAKEEITPNETTDVFELPGETLAASVKSLAEINDPSLFAQLPKSERHLKQIISTDYDYLLREHSLEKLSLDEDNVFVKNQSGNISYTLVATIPHSRGDETLSQFAYLTLNFNTDGNIDNELFFGFYMDHYLSFDRGGNILNNEDTNSRYYTKKPKNIPSKAPSSVICNFFAQNGTTSGPIASYCGLYGNSTVPAPQWILDIIFGDPQVYDYNDLYILSPSHPDGQIPFDTWNSFLFPCLKNKIIDFYQTVYIPQLGYPISTTQNLTASKHINKQAFIDSFFEWLLDMQAYYPENFNYLTNNPNVLCDIFEIFADHNTQSPEDAGIYLGIPFGQYSPNPAVVCITLGGQHLFTLNGRIHMGMYGAGAMTYDQFRALILPGCD